MTATSSVNRPGPTRELILGSIATLIPVVIFVGQLLNSPPPRAEGWVLAMLIVSTMALAGWGVSRYLAYQSAIQLVGGFIAVASWWDLLRGRAQAPIPAAQVTQIILRRPSYCDLETDGGTIRIGTMFWHRTQERQLEALARAAGVPLLKTG
jgi:hypothetical protein